MKLYGLIGYPLKHSFSKRYFSEKFSKENIDAHYENFEIPSIAEFPNIPTSNPNLFGINVTSPYKAQVIKYIDELSDEAARLNAVNCIKIERNENSFRTKGFNTDVFGFKNSVEPFLKPHHTKALILGTGGAARAVAEALRQLDIASQFVSRTPETGMLSYEEVSGEIISELKLIVNASPLGMHPHEEKFPPIPYSALSVNHLVYDLIYNPARTLFLQKAEMHGCTIKNGLEMLHVQAEKSWRIWNR